MRAGNKAAGGGVIDAVDPVAPITIIFIISHLFIVHGVAVYALIIINWLHDLSQQAANNNNQGTIKNITDLL